MYTKFLSVFREVSKNMAIQIFKDQVTPAQLELWILRAEVVK